MANFNGTKCISCGELFKDNDDVVVCPECGTPYHRECYNKEGQCINTVLHQSGESWKAEYVNNDGGDSAEAIKCIRCGSENPPEGLFCNKCGMPLHDNANASRPFNNMGAGFGGQTQGGAFPFGNQMVFDKESEIDGIKIDDYVKYTGKNSMGLISSFIKFGKFGGKIAINIGALVFPEFYFFYRKMYKLGVLFMTLTLLFSIPSMIVLGQSGMMNMTLLNTNFDVQSNSFTTLYSLSSYMMMGIRFLCGFFGTYWYFLTAKSDIRKIRSTVTDDYEAGVQIVAKGGTSMTAVIVAVTVYCVVTLLGFYLLNLKFA